MTLEPKNRNLVEVILCGGPRDRQRIKLPSVATVVDIPRNENSGLFYDRYRFTEEVLADEWLVFEFDCTQQSLEQDVV